MKRSASAPTVHRRADDPALTGHAGLMLVRDLNSKLHLVERLNAAVAGVPQLGRGDLEEKRVKDGICVRLGAGGRVTTAREAELGLSHAAVGLKS